jgi:hypothetical protein
MYTLCHLFSFVMDLKENDIELINNNLPKKNKKYDKFTRQRF